MRYEWIWVSISAWLELLSVHGLAQEALKQAFLEQDVYLRSAEGKVALRKAKGKPSGVTAQGMGCTAVVALIRQGVLYVANCGDSRAVLVSGAGAVAMPGALGDVAEDWLQVSSEPWKPWLRHLSDVQGFYSSCASEACLAAASELERR